MKLLFDEHLIDKKTEELAKKIDEKIKKMDADAVMMYIEKGGKPFFEKLLSKMQTKPITDSIRVKSYIGTQSSGKIEWLKKPSIDIKDKTCILVDDILDTGQTIKRVKEYLLKNGAKECLICVAVNKHERRLEDIEPDYYLFDLDGGFIIGFGMDYNEQYRDLPAIYLMGES
ncbi:phosphoribosyltransferase [Hippea jasoniae]|uniref:phosphoribosyltransferase n=1 Tax=Hippea jasoniae TaxID=944479 RepID=UPI00069082E3|nr:phosphoribosyltransferase family protein [Hippea jasoniae]